MGSIIRILVIPLALIICINAAFLLYLGKLSNQITPSINKVKDVEEFMDLATSVQGRLNAFVLTGSEKDSLAYTELVERLEPEAELLSSTYGRYFNDPSTLVPVVMDYKKVAQELFRAGVNGADLERASLSKLNMNISNRLGEIENYLITSNRATNQQLLLEIDSSKNVGYLLLIACLTLSFIATLVIYKQLVDPLRMLRKELKNLSEGKYPEIEINREDEIGDLITAFNETSKSLHRSEIKLKKSNLQLKVANRELQQFAYSVSHDLRTPLRSISGFSEALVSSYGDDLTGKAKDYLNRVHRAAGRMGELIDEILKLSRISRQETRTEKIDISELAREIVQMTETKQQKRAEIIIQPNIHLYGDKGLVKILMLNLISNAVKFSAPKDHPRIEIGKKDVQGKPYVFVSDNGIGFDNKYSDKVFAPFQRLHANGEIEGNGIGLATVKRIINKHDGETFIESEEGKGTTVYFNLGGDDV